MSGQVIEKHQLAGIDERERGFNRMIDIASSPEGCRAGLRYEAVVVVTDPCAGAAEALERLIGELHRRGYRQLKSRLSFQGETYLGSRLEWIEYPDPERPAEPSGGLADLWRRLRQRFGF
jgi:hypothetical protein